MISQQMENYYEKLRQTRRDAYRRANQTASSYPELIFMGDSITEWFPIAQKLRLSANWVNRGIAASNSQHLLDHLDCHLFGQSVQDVVLLIGTNDLAYGFSREDSLATIRCLVEAILADQVLAIVHLLEVLPVNEDQDYAETVMNRTNQAISALNAGLADLAEEFPRVELVKTYQAFLDDEGQLAPYLTKDGLHLSDAGYDLLASLVQPCLR